MTENQNSKQNHPLQYYDAARSALAQAANIDEVKNVKDKAEAIRLYAQQQRDDVLERYAAQIKTRAMRRLGELSRELEKAQPTRTHVQIPTGGKLKSEALKEAGLSLSTAHRCERLAAMPVEKFEAAVEKNVTVKEILKSANVHVGNNSGENEWYTPPDIIEAARRVMGSIDLDPASSEIANRTVKAKKFYTLEDDGLISEWEGNVWLNPPYSRDLIGRFCRKLVDEFTSLRTQQAIILVNNATETEWFQLLLEQSSAVCFPSSRIKFLDPSGKPTGAPLQGQAILYISESLGIFNQEFKTFGKVFRAI